MASSHQVLQAIADMQREGQERLPVIPNNGNPAGAHNMPHQPQAPAPAPVEDKYAWLKPSQAVDNIRALTSSIGTQAPAVQPVVPAVQQQAPVLPVRATQPVVLPQR